VEKRAATRYPVIMEVEFDHAIGWTCDVSTCGVCIEMEQPLALGEDIRFSMLKHHDGSETRLQCRGIVVRSLRHENRWRIGVVLYLISFNA